MKKNGCSISSILFFSFFLVFSFGLNASDEIQQSNNQQSPRRNVVGELTNAELFFGDNREIELMISSYEKEKMRKKSRKMGSTRAFCKLSPVLKKLVKTFKGIELEIADSSDTVIASSVIRGIFESYAERCKARISISEDGKITRRSSSRRHRHHRNGNQKSRVRIKKPDPSQSENQSAGDDSSQD